jgi:Immunity protein 32
MNITVEIKDGNQLERLRTEGGDVVICVDEEGLDYLLSQLRFLKHNRTDHVHFMTSEWGGGELSEKLQNAENLLVHHLRILLRAT